MLLKVSYYLLADSCLREELNRPETIEVKSGMHMYTSTIVGRVKSMLLLLVVLFHVPSDNVQALISLIPFT